jgi:hypothetical protein
MALTPAMERAAQRMARFSQRYGEALLLGRLASAAVRIEAHLLRRLRLNLLPDVDVGAEADLWFSPLVESRGATAVVLDASVAELLREDLGRLRTSDLRTLVRLLEITAESHRLAPATIRLEERILALALLEGDGAAGAIDEALRPALRTIRKGGDEARAVAQWALRALPRLPVAARATDSALALGLAAAALLGRRRVLKETPERPVDAASVRWAIPPAALANPVGVGVELLERGIRFSAPAAGVPSVEVPGTDPPFVILGWERDGSRIESLVAAEPGRTIDLDADLDEVTIATLAGDEYRLVRAVEEHAFAYDVYLSFAKADRAWAEKLQTDLAAEGIKAYLEPVELDLPPETEALDLYVDTARHFVVLWSDQARSSGWIRRELEAFEVASKEDPSRRLIVLNLQGRNEALAGYETIDDLARTGRYREGPGAIDGSAWRNAVDRIVVVLSNFMQTPLGFSAIRAVTQACVRVDTLGGQPVRRSGVRVSPEFIVTAAEPFYRIPLLAIDVPNPSGWGFVDGGQAEVLNPESDEGFLLLRPIRSDRSTSAPAAPAPLDLSTDWFKRGLLTTKAVVIGVEGEDIRAVAGRVVGSLEPEELTVRLPRNTAGSGFLGAPVVVDLHVCAIVTAIRAGTNQNDVADAVDTGTEAEDELDVMPIGRVVRELQRQSSSPAPAVAQAPAPVPTYRAAKLVVAGPPSSGRSALIKALGEPFAASTRGRATLWRIEAPASAPHLRALVAVSTIDMGDSPWSGDWPVALSFDGAAAIVLTTRPQDATWEHLRDRVALARRAVATAPILLMGILGPDSNQTDADRMARTLESSASALRVTGAVVISADSDASIERARELVLSAIENGSEELDPARFRAIESAVERLSQQSAPVSLVPLPEAPASGADPHWVATSMLGARLLLVGDELSVLSADAYGAAVSGVLRRLKGPVGVPAAPLDALRAPEGESTIPYLRDRRLSEAVITDLERVGVAYSIEVGNQQIVIVPSLMSKAQLLTRLNVAGSPLLVATWPTPVGPVYPLLLGAVAYWPQVRLRAASLESIEAGIGVPPVFHMKPFWIRATDQLGAARVELLVAADMSAEMRSDLRVLFTKTLTSVVPGGPANVKIVEPKRP